MTESQSFPISSSCTLFCSESTTALEHGGVSLHTALLFKLDGACGFLAQKFSVLIPKRRSTRPANSSNLITARVSLLTLNPTKENNADATPRLQLLRPRSAGQRFPFIGGHRTNSHLNWQGAGNIQQASEAPGVSGTTSPLAMAWHVDFPRNYPHAADTQAAATSPSRVRTSVKSSAMGARSSRERSVRHDAKVKRLVNWPQCNDTARDRVSHPRLQTCSHARSTLRRSPIPRE